MTSRRNTSAKMITFESAQTIGLLFDANTLQDRNLVLKYAKSLTKAGKKVILLGYMENTHENENYTFAYYNLKNIDWAKRPKGEVVDTFINENVDILISIHLQSNSHTEYIAALSKAAFKVGPIATFEKTFDLMLDTSNLSSLSEFIEQIENVLKKTKVRQQQPAAMA